jgi:hypothetical protein
MSTVFDYIQDQIDDYEEEREFEEKVQCSHYSPCDVCREYDANQQLTTNNQQPILERDVQPKRCVCRWSPCDVCREYNTSQQPTTNNQQPPILEREKKGVWFLSQSK